MLKLKPREMQAETDESNITRAIATAFSNATLVKSPYRHWLLDNALPKQTALAILALPLAAPRIPDTFGKRDSHNNLRSFFSPDLQNDNVAVADVVNAFQSDTVVGAIEALCGISLQGSYLRIEYCQDSDGFWLEPHMDIKEKHITIQIYLNTDSDAATLGTDIYDNDKKPFASAPAGLGQAMIFLPSEPQSWHGFEKRPIKSVRRSILINYVTDDWRSRHELAFPNRKIGQ